MEWECNLKGDGYGQNKYFPERCVQTDVEKLSWYYDCRADVWGSGD